MEVAERITAGMRLYQRMFSAGVLFSHLSENREQAVESVIMFLRFCEDEGLTPAGLMEGVPSPRSHIAHIKAHALLGLLPETNKSEAAAIVARFLRFCDEAGLLPAVVHERRLLNSARFPPLSGGNSPSLRAISTESPEIDPK